MSRRAARWLFFLFFLAYAVFLTYPGYLPFNRVRPLVLGLPFSFFWPGLWVAAAAFVFWAVDRAEAREREGR